MYILTPENKSYNTALIPDRTKTLHYGILDYSNPDDVDYHFIPMVFVETFPESSAELQIGQYRIQVPLRWSVLLGDQDFGDLEVMSLKKLNGRDFSVFVFNPCKGYMPQFLPIDIVDIYQEIKWSVPPMKPEHMLAVPLCDGENPPCAFFVDAKNKLPEVLDIRKMF